MKLYLLCGKARSGKDTFAGFLKEELEQQGKKVCILKLTAPLNDLLKTYFNWDGKDETKPRSLMQYLGYDVIIKKLGEKDFLVNNLITKIKVLDEYYDVGIITDGRLRNEVKCLSKAFKKDLKTIFISRRNNLNNGLSSDEKKHQTENDLIGYMKLDYVVINKGLEEFKRAAETRVREDFHE